MKELILATKPFAREQINRSRWELGITVVMYLMAFTLQWFLPFSIQLAMSVLLGLLVVRLFIIYHDYLHKAILWRESWSRLFFTIFGLAILVPPSVWQRSHDYHHKHNSKLYTSSIGSFPIVTVERYLKASQRERFLYMMIRSPWVIGLGYFFTFLFGMCIRPFFKNPRLHLDAILSLFIHFGIAGVIYYFGGWSLVFTVWWIPSLIACGLGTYLFYAQHNFPGASYASKDGWTYGGAAMESSSYMKMNPLMRWFTGNIGYHHIHHLNSRIPFYRLPEAYSKLAPLQHAKTTSLNPGEIMRCLCLKVYDPKQERLISKRELENTYMKEAIN